jgi:hypothetical protein
MAARHLAAVPPPPAPGPAPEGMTTCPDCGRPIFDALFAAHQRREAGLDWFSRRRPAAQRQPGAGSRSRDTTEGRGRGRARWEG